MPDTMANFAISLCKCFTYKNILIADRKMSNFRQNSLLICQGHRNNAMDV